MDEWLKAQLHQSQGALSLGWPPRSSYFLAPTLQTKLQFQVWLLFRSKQQTVGSHHSQPVSGYTSSGSPSPGPPPYHWPLTSPTTALQSWRLTPWTTWWASSVWRADRVSSGSTSLVRARGGPASPILIAQPWCSQPSPSEHSNSGHAPWQPLLWLRVVTVSSLTLQASGWAEAALLPNLPSTLAMISVRASMASLGPPPPLAPVGQSLSYSKGLGDLGESTSLVFSLLPQCEIHVELTSFTRSLRTAVPWGHAQYSNPRLHPHSHGTCPFSL